MSCVSTNCITQHSSVLGIPIAYSNLDRGRPVLQSKDKQFPCAFYNIKLKFINCVCNNKLEFLLQAHASLSPVLRAWPFHSSVEDNRRQTLIQTVMATYEQQLICYNLISNFNPKFIHYNHVYIQACNLLKVYTRTTK